MSDWRTLDWLPRFEISEDGRLRRKAFPRKADVREIRASHTGKYGQVTAMARQYGVSRTSMKAIIYGKSWIELEVRQ